MARDSNDQGLPGRRDFSPAPRCDAWVDQHAVLGRAIDSIGAHMEASRTKVPVLEPDCAGYFEDMAERDVAAVAAKVRQALADTLQGEFTDEQVRGAASIIVDYPTSWRDYSPMGHGTPPALSAYKSALRELADPSLTVARLEQLAQWQIDASSKEIDAAKETLGRFLWASAKPDELANQFTSRLNLATAKAEEGARLMGLAAGFKAKMEEAV